MLLYRAEGPWELWCEGVFHLCFPVALGLEQPDYDLDSEDEVLLSRLNMKMEIKPVQFETMMERLEKASTQRVSTHSGGSFGPSHRWCVVMGVTPAGAPGSCFTAVMLVTCFCFSSSLAGVLVRGQAAAGRGRLRAEVCV